MPKLRTSSAIILSYTLLIVSPSLDLHFGWFQATIKPWAPRLLRSVKWKQVTPVEEGVTSRPRRIVETKMTGKSVHTRRFAEIAFLVLLVTVGATIIAMRSSIGAPALFRRLVIRPIPKSVQNMRLDRVQMATFGARLHGYRSRAYVLRFDISREDLSQIVATRGFEPWDNPTYTDGVLKYKTTKGSFASMYLYWPKLRPAPNWFDLEAWTGFETYFIGQDQLILGRADVSLLLYDEQLGSAYLVKWEKRER
jgi:hypothetical protein